jgi:hypothetical protein
VCEAEVFCFVWLNILFVGANNPSPENGVYQPRQEWRVMPPLDTDRARHVEFWR